MLPAHVVPKKGPRGLGLAHRFERFLSGRSRSALESAHRRSTSARDAHQVSIDRFGRLAQFVER